MIRILFEVILTFIFVQTTFAQNIAVENFNHHKHYFWQINSTLPLDKNSATLLLKTEIKGFEFKTVKGNPIESEEGDEGILLKVPDKSKYIIISHPDFGEYDWRVPVNYLKKHNYYTGDLIALNLTKEYINPNQWVIFNISPENSILTIDSVMHRVSDGKISLYLPVGTHSYLVESPFYEEVEDSILLTDSRQLEKNIFLQPLYSYLNVKIADPDVLIYIDEEFKGKNDITVGRLAEGNHRLSFLKNNQWVKDTVIKISVSEKKTIFIPEDLTTNNFLVESEIFRKNPSPNIYLEITEMKKEPNQLIRELKSQDEENIFAQLHLIAEDSLTVIKVDREIVGKGEWQGLLPSGFHIISTEKNGRESLVQQINIIDDTPLEIILNTHASSIGMVNIHSNVEGATIRIDDVYTGVTPLLVKNLTAGENHTISLTKDGYVSKNVTVRPKGNEIIEVYVELK